MIISTRKEKAMKRKTFVLGALTGAAAGTVAGVFFAPKSGKETRKEVADDLKSIKEEVIDRVRKMEHITKAKYHRAVEAIVSGYQEAKKITPEQAKEISDILDESFIKIQEAAKKELK